MAKHFVFLAALVTGLLAFLPCTIALNITDIFTVQPGSSNGGCDSRKALLDQWITEGSQSIDIALKAIDAYEEDLRVRRSMSVIFGIANSQKLGENAARAKAVSEIRDNIEWVGKFFNQAYFNGKLVFDKAEFWLLCDSTFLTLHEPTSPASDYLGNAILDENNLLADGTNLGDAIPKSTTLLHELFHAVHGDRFLAGDEEKYDIASCLSLRPAQAQQNPENYVFFIAHMCHMRGASNSDKPWSISTHWDFHITGKGKNRIFGASEVP